MPEFEKIEKNCIKILFGIEWPYFKNCGTCMKILWFAIAGVCGTLLRYWLGGFVQRAYGGVFPWGTFAVNMAGCFLFGFVWSVAEDRMLIGAEFKAILLIGFMGAFTTFSSFVFETGQLIRDSQWMLAFGNIALQNITGIMVFFAGLYAGRLL